MSIIIYLVKELIVTTDCFDKYLISKGTKLMGKLYFIQYLKVCEEINSPIPPVAQWKPEILVSEEIA